MRVYRLGIAVVVAQHVDLVDLQTLRRIGELSDALGTTCSSEKEKSNDPHSHQCRLPIFRFDINGTVLG